VAGKIRPTEKIHLIGTRYRDLPACSIVPQDKKYLDSKDDYISLKVL
jgi:hypothetical protein